MPLVSASDIGSVYLTNIPTHMMRTNFLTSDVYPRWVTNYSSTIGPSTTENQKEVHIFLHIWPFSAHPEQKVCFAFSLSPKSSVRLFFPTNMHRGLPGTRRAYKSRRTTGGNLLIRSLHLYISFTCSELLHRPQSTWYHKYNTSHSYLANLVFKRPAAHKSIHIKALRSSRVDSVLFSTTFYFLFSPLFTGFASGFYLSKTTMASI